MNFYFIRNAKYLICSIILCSFLFIIYGCNPTSSSSGTVPADVQAIFTANCIGCHGDGGTAPNLTDGKSYASLVNVDSTTSVNTFKQKGQKITMYKLVVPGEPENSWLAARVFATLVDDNNQKLLDRMPLNANALTDAEVTIILKWIKNLSDISIPTINF